METESQNIQQSICKLAIASLALGIIGPFTAGALWVLSLNNFLNIGKPVVFAVLSCGPAWMLGLVFGIAALKKIDINKGYLVGKEYAVTGIIISAAWMFLVFLSLFLPVIYSVDS